MPIKEIAGTFGSRAYPADRARELPRFNPDDVTGRQ